MDVFYITNLLKKAIEIKTGKKINIAAISAKNIKNVNLKSIKKYFILTLKLLKEKEIDIVFESIDFQMVFQKR